MLGDCEDTQSYLESCSWRQGPVPGWVCSTLRSSVFSSDSQEEFLPAQWKLGFPKKLGWYIDECFFLGDFVHLWTFFFFWYSVLYRCLIAVARNTFRIGAPSLVDSAESDGETAMCDRSSHSEESEEREHREKPPWEGGFKTSNQIPWIFPMHIFLKGGFPLKKK